MRHLRWLMALALLATAVAVPLRAQDQSWQFRWFWGAKVGATSTVLPSTGSGFDASFGGDWMITARRTALYLSYTRTPAGGSDTFSNFSGASVPIPIAFDAMNRIQIAVLVLPLDGQVQPYLGGGFVLEMLTNYGLVGTLSHADSVIVARDLDDKASGAFTLLMGGVQYRMGRTAVFGQVQYSPQARSFLLSGNSLTIEFGVRYALTGAREDDVTTRR
jgi:hypothetical protein